MAVADSYPGGKAGAGITQRIISDIPPHRRWISGFAGHCAVTRWKRPAEQTVLIDRDPAVIEWWEKRSATFPNGIFNHNPTPRKRRGQVAIVTRRPLQIDLLIGNVFDWISYASDSPLHSTDPSGDFLYLDPPDPLYAFEMCDADHRRLLVLACELRCNVLIHCYTCDFYANALRNWRTWTYRAMTRGGTLREEQVWTNYTQPTRLHDYRWIGGTKQRRCSLARRQDNLLRWLDELPELERLQTLASVAGEYEDVLSWRDDDG